MTTTEQNAIAEYKSATPAGKKLLEKIFGPELFAGKPSTFEEAHTLFLKKKFKDPLFLILQKREVKELTASDKLIIIANILQGDWKPDWSNSNQYKYYPWFRYDKTKSGFGFSITYYDLVFSFASVGSRLCFPDSDTAEYFGKQFLALHNDFLTIK